MQVLTSIQDMRAACKALRDGPSQKTLGLVPTMGALHAGHISLVRAARQRCDVVAATIFVNPLQFGPSEDFAKYPRMFDEDCSMLEAEGVDVLFAPAHEEMYPTYEEAARAQAWVDVPEVGGRLDGASRPGHFRGVATVVTKLFHIIQPQYAFFGQKDAAQIAVLRTMVRDLNFDVEIVACPIIRDEDGLALSSRNLYLNAEERQTALALSRSLCKVERAFAQGQRDANALRKILAETLKANDGLRVDYAEIVDAETLRSVSDVYPGALVAVAAWIGKTRLIDNLILPLGDAA